MPAGLGECSPFPDRQGTTAQTTQCVALSWHCFPFLVLKWDQENTLPMNEAAPRVKVGGTVARPRGSEPPAADQLRKCSVPAWAQVRPATPSSRVTGPGKEWSVVVLCGGDERGGEGDSFVPLQNPGMMSHNLFPVFHTPRYFEICLQLVPDQAQDCTAPFSQIPKLSRKVFLQAALLPRQSELGALVKRRRGC